MSDSLSWVGNLRFPDEISDKEVRILVNSGQICCIEDAYHCGVKIKCDSCESIDGDCLNNCILHYQYRDNLTDDLEELLKKRKKTKEKEEKEMTSKSNIQRVKEVVFANGKDITSISTILSKTKLTQTQVDNAIDRLEKENLLVRQGDTKKVCINYDGIKKLVMDVVEVVNSPFSAKEIHNKIGSWMEMGYVGIALSKLKKEDKIQGIQYTGHTPLYIKSGELCHYASDISNFDRTITVCGEVRDRNSKEKGLHIVQNIERVTCPGCKGYLSKQPSIYQYMSGCGLYACTAIVKRKPQFTSGLYCCDPNMHPAMMKQMMNRMHEQPKEEIKIEVFNAENEDKAFRVMFNKMSKDYDVVKIEVSEVKPTHKGGELMRKKESWEKDIR